MEEFTDVPLHIGWVEYRRFAKGVALPRIERRTVWVPEGPGQLAASGQPEIRSAAAARVWADKFRRLHPAPSPPAPPSDVAVLRDALQPTMLHHREQFGATRPRRVRGVVDPLELDPRTLEELVEDRRSDTLETLTREGWAPVKVDTQRREGAGQATGAEGGARGPRGIRGIAGACECTVTGECKRASTCPCLAGGVECTDGCKGHTRKAKCDNRASRAAAAPDVPMP